MDVSLRGSRVAFQAIFVEGAAGNFRDEKRNKGSQSGEAQKRPNPRPKNMVENDSDLVTPKWDPRAQDFIVFRDPFLSQKRASYQLIFKNKPGT